MVRWFDPGVLIKILRPVITSGIFGTYADRRLIQAALDQGSDSTLYGRTDIRNTLSPRPDGEIWFDFIADTGDGFDSTYTVAWLQAQESLTIDQEITRRGQMLILGGDQVYPDATLENYEEHFKKVFSWAWPDDDSPEDGRPRIYAIPGNHDWYDGLDLFLAFFCGKKPWKVGMWRAEQRRSYFALQLTNDLWIWGVDIQLSEKVDQPQAEYFRSIASKMPRSSSIIICTAAPGWYHPTGNAHHCLGYFHTIARKADRDLRVPLVLSGDVHHYSRYIAEPDKTQFITAGGGGAFLHPTHSLRNQMGISWGGTSQLLSLARRPEDQKPVCYPPMAKSRALLFWNLFLPFLNLKFAALFGFLYTFAGLTTLMWNDLGNVASMLWNFVWWLWLIIFVALFIAYEKNEEWVIGGKLLSKPPPKGLEKSWIRSLYECRKYILGTVHGICHFGACTTLSAKLYLFIVNQESFDFWTWGFNVEFVIRSMIIGGLVGAFIFGVYLITTSLLIGVNSNDAFSTLSLTSYRNFLRLRVKDGKLTIFPIGVGQVPIRSQWKPRTMEPAPSLVFPVIPIEPILIEKPIEIEIPSAVVG